MGESPSRSARRAHSFAVVCGGLAVLLAILIFSPGRVAQAQNFLNRGNSAESRVQARVARAYAVLGKQQYARLALEVDTLRMLSGRYGDSIGTLYAAWFEAQLLFSMGRAVRAIDLLDSLQILYSHTSRYREKALIALSMGQMQNFLGNYPRSAANLRKAYDYAAQIEDASLITSILIAQIDNQISLELFDNASYSLKRVALFLAGDTISTNALSYLVSQGDFNMATGNVGLAADDFLRASSIARATGNRVLQIQTLVEAASAMVELHALERTRVLLDSATRMSLWQPNLSNSQLIDETWGDYYRAAKQPLRAETYYQQALAASIVLQSGVQQIHLLQRLTELYRETQQLQAAYGATMRAYQIQDSIHAFLALRNFASADAEAQHEIDIYHAELKAHMEEAQFNRTRQKRHAVWWMMGGVLLACGFFLYVLSRSYHFRKVSNRHLEAQEREIERTRSELQKTITQNEELRAESMQQTQRINEAKLEIQGHNSQLMNSIEYANSIQQSIFPTERALNPYLAESFLLSRPRDIVSGDLPWFAPVDQALVMAMIDCTGHGVAGASLSFIVYSILNEIVIERRVTDPSTIIYQFNQGACNLLANTERKFRSRIRMDISVLSLFPKAGYALYAGWNQFLFYCADGRRIARLMGNPGLLILSEKPVEAAVNQRIELTEKCTFYLATDGYANQMNADLEKIGAARLMALLEEVQPLALSQQKARLVNFLVRHKLGADQTDDITILGFRL